jgi:hypothetical protein
MVNALIEGVPKKVQFMTLRHFVRQTADFRESPAQDRHLAIQIAGKPSNLRFPTLKAQIRLRGSNSHPVLMHRSVLIVPC